MVTVRIRVRLDRVSKLLGSGYVYGYNLGWGNISVRTREIEDF